MIPATFQLRGRRVRAAWALGAAVFALSGLAPAHAILVGAGRFDQMVSASDAIVKFRVERFEEAPFEMIGFSGTVLYVLKTDGEPIAPEQTFEAAFPVWPEDLGLKSAAGQTVLLVLKRYEGALRIDWNMRAILPAVEGAGAVAEDAAPERKIFLELQAFLETGGDGREQARILALMGALGDAGDLAFFESQAASADPWVRRGAQAAAAQIDPRPERIEPLIEDFKTHLADPVATGSEEDLVFWQIYDDVHWASRCGDIRREESLASRAKAYLPVYRVLIDRAPPGYGRIPIGIEGLRNVGTVDDLPRLVRFLDHEKRWVRHDVLEGLGRILGHPCKRPLITSYEMPLPPGVESWERETRAELERILAEQNARR